MRRKSSIKRKTALKRVGLATFKRKTPYKMRLRDMDYMGWVKRQPCIARDLGGCCGRVEADHAGRRALGRKAEDRTCIPLCATHHTQRGSFSGPFRAWTQVQMRLWLITAIVDTNAAYKQALVRQAA